MASLQQENRSLQDAYDELQDEVTKTKQASSPPAPSNPMPESISTLIKTMRENVEDWKEFTSQRAKVIVNIREIKCQLEARLIRSTLVDEFRPDVDKLEKGKKTLSELEKVLKADVEWLQQGQSYGPEAEADLRRKIKMYKQALKRLDIHH